MVIVNSNGVLQENTKYKFTITEIFGEDSLLWKQKYNGVAASELQNIEIRDKTVYINRKLIATIAKKTNKNFFISFFKIKLNFSIIWIIK